MTQVSTVPMTIWTTITTIPLPIWTGLMGLMFTLLGVLVANRHSKQQLKTQLEHDANEKKKARISEMRKSVYLPAAEEMVKANSILGQVADTDLARVNIGKDLAPFFASMMKLQIVGEPTTAKLANSLASTYGELLGKTLTKAMPIRDVVSKLEIKDGRYDELQVEIKRLLAAMNAHNEAGAIDSDKFDRLMRALETQQRWAAEVESERAALRAQSIDLRLEFLQSIHPMMKGVQAQFLPLLIEVRRELDLHGDIEEFQMMLDAQAERMEGMINQFTNDLKTRARGSETSDGS